MTDRDFVYWLQGFFEISDSKTLSEAQVAIIKEHLQLVFNKVTGPKTICGRPGMCDCDLGEYYKKFSGISGYSGYSC